MLFQKISIPFHGRFLSLNPPPLRTPANPQSTKTWRQPQKFSKWEPFLLADPFFLFHFFQYNNSTLPMKLMNKVRRVTVISSREIWCSNWEISWKTWRLPGKPGELAGMPPEIPFQCHTFVQKIGLLKPPSPLEFLLTFLGVGMDIFWNYTIKQSGLV